MFERAGPWPFILGWLGLGCNSSHTSDWILLSIVCWVCCFLSRCVVTALVLSRSARNILWACLGAAVRECTLPEPGTDWLAIEVCMGTPPNLDLNLQALIERFGSLTIQISLPGPAGNHTSSSQEPSAAASSSSPFATFGDGQLFTSLLSLARHSLTCPFGWS